jgi:hypothetical protein
MSRIPNTVSKYNSLKGQQMHVQFSKGKLGTNKICTGELINKLTRKESNDTRKGIIHKNKLKRLEDKC